MEMLHRKITIYLKQKRFVFGLLNAKYWAENAAGIAGEREGFRDIHIYEAELTCKKSVQGFESVHSGGKIEFSNQDKLRKKFNSITTANAAGVNPSASHARDIEDVEELVSTNAEDENVAKSFRAYYQEYVNYPVRAIRTNFITAFPSPLKTIVQSENGCELYELNFESAKLYNFSLSKVQDEGAESSGTIEGMFIGYVVDLIPQEIEVEISETRPFVSLSNSVTKKYPYLTGRSETKTVGREIFKRYESCDALGEFTWTLWYKVGLVSNPQRAFTFWEALFWLVIFVIFLAILIYSWPLLIAIGIVGLFAWLLSLNWSTRLFNGIGRLIGGVASALSVILLLGGLLAFIINADIFGRKHLTTSASLEEGKKQELIVDGDTIISHYREWTDYHGNKYNGYLRIKASDYREARYFRINYYTVNGEKEYTDMCGSLVRTDNAKMDFVYAFFDSIKVGHNLNRDQFAEAVVTCVQDIPYYLITPGPCVHTAYPPSDFAYNYLLGGGLCEGYENNGILSPAEFTATLKGDCDTRTVFTYAILKHFGYEVSIYGSEYYGHSILGIALENKPHYSMVTKTEQDITYYMCELTTYGPKLGQLPQEVSDMAKWKLELN